MPRRIPLEVCIDSLDSANAAAPLLSPGDRFEVCSSLLAGGGLTPSIGLVLVLKELYPDIALFVMIRPRPGSFVYTHAEVEIMAADIKAFRSAGVDGIVVGCLHPDGEVDIETTQLLADVAEPLPVTFHRAFDVTPDWQRAADDISSIRGITRILTSGHSATAIQGAAELDELFRYVPRHITVIPASGLNADTLAELWRRAPLISEAHLSASAPYNPGPTPTLARGVALGFGSGDEWRLNPHKLEAVVDLAERYAERHAP
ncbi:Copper homeostasis protein cutC [Vanrija pseudolonga]|uniref:Copper homeostasis protein cutC homolog n=1 Tax=Vanrija pseudolonga TaxID=143232 RepID=A0AAF0YCI4_9TREE|nr:Copper homeostasis protein cutC [Vanrija pseudolonga]